MALDRLEVSGICGSISLACWIIVFTPQIYENWRRQSSEGLSMAFVVIWLIGDLFNVFGSLIQHVLPTMIILAVYYTAADLVLLYQCVSYGDRSPVVAAAERVSGAVDSERQALLPASSSAVSRAQRLVQRLARNPVVKNTVIVLTVVLCGVAGYYLGGHQKNPDPQDPQPFSFWGQLLGWICAFFYLASRVPQLRLNYKRKSTDGVAVLFFVFTLLGNITYCASIFAADSSLHAIAVNASWILGAFGSLILDFVVLIQFWIYRK